MELINIDSHNPASDRHFDRRGSVRPSSREPISISVNHITPAEPSRELAPAGTPRKRRPEAAREL